MSDLFRNIVKLLCSHCGNYTYIPYTAHDVIDAVKDGWSSYGAALYCPECSVTWAERNDGRTLQSSIHTIQLIDELHKGQ